MPDYRDDPNLGQGRSDEHVASLNGTGFMVVVLGGVLLVVIVLSAIASRLIDGL